MFNTYMGLAVTPAKALAGEVRQWASRVELTQDTIRVAERLMDESIGANPMLCDIARDGAAVDTAIRRAVDIVESYSIATDDWSGLRWLRSRWLVSERRHEGNGWLGDDMVEVEPNHWIDPELDARLVPPHEWITDPGHVGPTWDSDGPLVDGGGGVRGGRAAGSEPGWVVWDSDGPLVEDPPLSAEVFDAQAVRHRYR